jgi:hypothetical protein
MASIYHDMPRDAQLALTEFSTEFDKAFALGDIEQWAGMIGVIHISDSIRTTFPMPISAAGYKRREGDDKLRALYERSLSMVPESWYDGVEALAKVIESGGGEFIGWGNEPANMAMEALRHTNVLVADMLANNPLLDFYRIDRPGGSTASAIRLFASAHPYNVLDSGVGTFDNDWSDGDTVEGDTVPGELNATLVKQCRRHFRSICGPNGRPLGLRFAGFLVPAAQEEAALDAFSRDKVLEAIQNVAASENVGGAAMPNRHVGTRVIVADELTGELPSGETGDADTVYAFAEKAGGMTPPPWIVQRGTAPEEIIYDKTDAKYKDSGLVGVKEVLDAACAAALPHAIVRINLSS